MNKSTIITQVKSSNPYLLHLLRTVRIFDNNGKTFDRYTIVFMLEPEKNGFYVALAMSSNPCHPQGYGQHCTARPGKHLGNCIDFDALPEPCQKLVIKNICFTDSIKN
ncbi:hypothetical protein [Methylomonas sp. AM2-LC]|uniref:hypothetical protein n=1 Tax=Methylomonas sp. AM2-LC TaxID=3153301 RepID=UPI003264B6D8